MLRKAENLDAVVEVVKEPVRQQRLAFRSVVGLAMGWTVEAVVCCCRLIRYSRDTRIHSCLGGKKSRV